MSEPREINSTPAAQARPTYEDLMGEIATLRDYIALQRAIVDEALALEQIAVVGRDDPHEGARRAKALQASFAQATDVSLPHLQRALREAYSAQIYRVFPRADEAPAVAPSTYDDFQRVDAFLTDPGASLPGAEPAPMPFPSKLVDGLVRFEGAVLPWVLSSQGVRRTALAELTRYMQATGLERGIIVGTHIEPGVEIPVGILFVRVN